MIIADLLTADSVIAHLRAGSKKHILTELAAKAAGLAGLPSADIFGVLNEREKAGSTGFGGGIAIPHGKLLGLARPMGIFARLERPVEFDAIDNQPVDLIFLLLMPKGAVAEHLKGLAMVSRLLRDRTLCAKLRGSDSADALYLLLTEAQASHAA